MKDLAGLWLFARRQRYNGSRWLVVAAVGIASLLLLMGTAIVAALGAQQAREGARADLAGTATQGVQQPIRHGLLTIIGVPPRTSLSMPGFDNAGLEPGEMLVSPTLMKELIHDGFIRSRLPWQPVGVLGRQVLNAPDDYLAVIATVGPEIEGVAVPSLSSSTGQGLVELTTILLLAPVTILIGVACRFNARRQQHQLAVLSLTGAGPRQLRTLATIAALLVTLPAMVLSLAAALPVRWLLARLLGFYPQDLTFSFSTVIAVAVGVPMVAVVGARLGLRQIEATPFAVQRRVVQRGASLLRLLPLLAGVAVYVGAISASRVLPDGGLAAGEAVGIVLVLTGLVVAGPTLVRSLARLEPPRGHSAAGLVAARRLSSDPHNAFRGVAALSAVTFVFTIQSSLDLAATSPALWPSADLTIRLDGVTSGGLVPALASTPGVTAVAPVAMRPSAQLGGQVVLITTCAGLPALRITLTSGVCTDGSLLAADSGAASGPRSPAGVRLPAEPPRPISGRYSRPSRNGPSFAAVLPLPPAELATTALNVVLVTTDKKPMTAESVTATAARTAPLAVTEWPAGQQNQFSQFAARFSRNTRMVMSFVILLALTAITLTVAEGLVERRRQTAMLSAIGMTSRQTRRWVAIEVGVPLFVAVVPSAITALTMTMAALALLPGAQLRLSLVDVALPGTFAAAIAALTTLLLTATLRSLPVQEELREE